jgi:hypothetical protein
VGESGRDGVFLGVLAEAMDAQGAAEAETAFEAKIDEFPGALGFGGREKHGAGQVQKEIHARRHFLAEELHGGETGAGGGLPIDVAGVITRNIGALVLEVDGTAGALTEDGAAGAAPLAAT